MKANVLARDQIDQITDYTAPGGSSEILASLALALSVIFSYLGYLLGNLMCKFGMRIGGDLQHEKCAPRTALMDSSRADPETLSEKGEVDVGDTKVFISDPSEELVDKGAYVESILEEHPLRVERINLPPAAPQVLFVGDIETFVPDIYSTKEPADKGARVEPVQKEPPSRLIHMYSSPTSPQVLFEKWEIDVDDIEAPVPDPFSVEEPVNKGARVEPAQKEPPSGLVRMNSPLTTPQVLFERWEIDVDDIEAPIPDPFDAGEFVWEGSCVNGIKGKGDEVLAAVEEQGHRNTPGVEGRKENSNNTVGVYVFPLALTLHHIKLRCL